jgi:hypothetical protein
MDTTDNTSREVLFNISFSEPVDEKAAILNTKEAMNTKCVKVFVQAQKL